MKSWQIPNESNKEPCVAVAFAIACEVSLDAFIAKLETRGGKIAGTYHLQQCMDVAFIYGFATSLIQFSPSLITMVNSNEKPKLVYFPEGKEERFKKYLRSYKGVLAGVRNKGSERPVIGHAVAWDTKNIYDPRGFIYQYDEALNAPHYLLINNFCLLTRMIQG